MARTESFADEFDCIECGRHIISFMRDPELPKLCGVCIGMPGWFRIPEVRDLIDPDVRPPELEDYVDETKG